MGSPARKGTVNHLLRQERLLRRWRQKDLADRLGSTTNNVSRWELGLSRPGPFFRTRLCEVFGKSAEALGLQQGQSPIPAPLEVSLPEKLPAACSDVSLPGVWGIPYPRNPFFTGRQAILHQLGQLLGQEKALLLSQSWAISGSGGMGKTQTAIEYAYRYVHEYSALFWISAESAESIISSFATMADLLDLAEKQEPDQEKMVAGVLSWLGSHSGWLLIFDNVEHPQLVKKFLPPARRGCLLFTSRQQALSVAARILVLEPMLPEEGVRFLLARARLPAPTASTGQQTSLDEATAREIVTALGGLPLALDQAAAYIEATRCSLTDYLQLFQSCSLRLLGERDEAHDHPFSVARTFGMAFEQLEHDHPAARALLTACAFLAPEPIPETLFLQGAGLLGPACEAFADPYQFHAALKALLTYSLLQRDPRTHTVTIHRLVQVVLRGYLSEGEQRAWMAGTIAVIGQFFAAEEHLHIDYWQTCTQLLPHALACIERAEQWHDAGAELIALMSQVGLYLSRRARFAEAERLLLLALSLGEQALEPAHSLMADVLYRLGFHYNLQGRYQEAIPCYERALQIVEGKGEAEHPLHAEIAAGLAGRYRELGRYQEAEPLFLRALRLTENAPGPKAAFPLQGLATLYEYQGRYMEAEPLYQRALQIREQAFGRTHPQVAGLLTDLGFVSVKQGKDEQGEALLRRALLIFEQTVGPEHSYVAFPLNILAGLQVQKGDHVEAEQLYQRALTLRQQQLGPEHPAVAETLHDLGCFRQAQQRAQEALALFRQAFAIRQHILGADHPQTRETYRLLQELEYMQEMVSGERLE